MNLSANSKNLSSTLANQTGFTLLELLIVTTILGILVSMISIALNPAQKLKEASQTKLKANLNQAAVVIENCVAAELGKKKSFNDIYTTDYTTEVGGCGNVQYLYEQNYNRNFPNSINVTANSSVPLICLAEAHGDTTLWYATTTGFISGIQPVGC